MLPFLSKSEMGALQHTLRITCQRLWLEVIGQAKIQLTFSIDINRYFNGRFEIGIKYT